MNDPIFKRKDFTLCEVPVPKGYPQSQTHAGIGYHDGVFYLTTSPYPNPRRSRLVILICAIIKKITFGKISLLYKGEDFENPCLYIEEKRNQEGIPIVFKPIGNNPLMDKPLDKYGLGSYCSDPDLFIDNGILNVLNRTSIRKQLDGAPGDKYETQVNIICGSVHNGLFVNKRIVELFKEQDASPCLISYDGRYIYMSLETNSYNTGEECKGLFYRENLKLDQNWTKKCEVKVDKGLFEPWHMSLFKYKDCLYSIIACVRRGEKQRCWQLLGEFNSDLSRLFIYQTPLTDFKSYRGSAIVDEKGEMILYSTTVNERIRGSKSVDGRDVIMAHAPFEQVLELLKKNG